MYSWIEPPSFDDDYRTFSAYVLHYSLLVAIAIGTIMFLSPTAPSDRFFVVVALALFVACFALLNKRRVQAAGGLFLAGLWVVVTANIVYENGIQNAGFNLYVIIILYAAIVFSRRVVLYVTGLCLSSSLILAAGEVRDVLPLNRSALVVEDRVYLTLGVFLLAGIVLSSASHTIRSSLSRLRHNEQTLQERNRLLEAEIRERERIAADLRESEEHYRILFENTSVLAGIYDREGRIVLINAAAARVLGSTPDALRGKSVFDVFPQAEAEKAFERQQRVMSTGLAELSEGDVTMPDSRYIYYLRHIVPLMHESGSPVSQVLVLTTDITERKQAQKQAQALAIANEKNAFYSDFFSTISHDLKTPLSIMNTTLYLLRRIDNPDQREQKLAEMGEQVGLLDKYIQDMLMISRMEHLPTFNRAPLDLYRLIQDVSKLLRPRIDAKHIEYQIEMIDTLPSLSADEEQIQRAVVNLVENAINYTPSGGKIRITTSPADAHALLEVTDSGIGIAPEDLSRIFDRFYRASSARDTGVNGTGLGLAIVKQVVDMHGGEITVESQPGRGTSFRVLLPLDARFARGQALNGKY